MKPCSLHLCVKNCRVIITWIFFWNKNYFWLISNSIRNVVEGLEKLIKAIAKFGDVMIKVAEMMGLLQNVLKTWFNEAACIVVGKPLNKVYMLTLINLLSKCFNLLCRVILKSDWSVGGNFHFNITQPWHYFYYCFSSK